MPQFFEKRMYHLEIELNFILERKEKTWRETVTMRQHVTLQTVTSVTIIFDFQIPDFAV